MAISIICGHCGLGVQPTVIQQHTTAEGRVRWLQCPNCQDGSVMTFSGVCYPVAPVGVTVPNLPGDVEQAWREARSSHSVGAYTAAEIMCRKILMHIAVDIDAAKPGKTFTEYIDALDKAGYITTGLKPAVDLIRRRGNVANHDLPASSEHESRATIDITQHLLASIYQFTALEGEEP